jgi:hypothetical protein
MIIKAMTNADSVERIFITVRNTTGSALSAGYNLCLNTRNVNSAYGIDVEQPATSAFPNYTGVVANDSQDTDYAIEDKSVGLAQVWGENEVAFIRVESTDGVVPVGRLFIPTNGQWYATSTGPPLDQDTVTGGALVIMSARGAATFEGRHRVQVRCL